MLAAVNIAHSTAHNIVSGDDVYEQRAVKNHVAFMLANKATLPHRHWRKTELTTHKKLLTLVDKTLKQKIYESLCNSFALKTITAEKTFEHEPDQTRDQTAVFFWFGHTRIMILAWRVYSRCP